MYLDTGTLIGIVIALAGQLHRVINQKNEKIRFLQAELLKEKRVTK
jgi:hypothetical protein